MPAERTTALILCGGKGTRLQGLHPNTPKPMIPVAGKPFLEWLALWLAEEGLRDFLYAAGYRAEVVEAWAAGNPIPGLSLRARRETEPLGTGGGILHGLDDCAETVLAMNGDSMLLFHLAPMFELLNKADMVIAASYSADCSRYGSLRIGMDGRLENFQEKKPGEGYINGGIYLFRKSVLKNFPRNQPLSMEYDILPKLLAANVRIAVHCVRSAPFIDIGLPQTLEQADGFICANAIWFGQPLNECA